MAGAIPRKFKRISYSESGRRRSGRCCNLCGHRAMNSYPTVTGMQPSGNSHVDANPLQRWAEFRLDRLSGPFDKRQVTAALRGVDMDVRHLRIAQEFLDDRFSLGSVDCVGVDHHMIMVERP